MFSELTYFFCAIAPMVGVVNVGWTSHFLVGLMGPPRLYREPRSSSPTGARRGEPLALTWADVDMRAKTLNFRQGLKSGGDVALFCERLCLFKQRLVYGRMHRQVSTGFVIRNIAQQPLPLVLR